MIGATKSHARARTVPVVDDHVETQAVDSTQYVEPAWRVQHINGDERPPSLRERNTDGKVGPRRIPHFGN